MNREVLTFNPIIYNGLFDHYRRIWNGYELNEHERNIAREAYNYLRTAHEIEEIKMFADLGYINKTNDIS
jgi:hypothetical protein